MALNLNKINTQSVGVIKSILVMKKLFFGLLFLATVGAVLIGCEKLSNDIQQPKQPKSTNWIADDFDLFPFRFPENTDVIIQGDSIHFDLPEGYAMIGLTDDNTFLQVNGGGGSITCTCLSGSGGCSPVKKGKDYACVMTTCSNCEKSTSSSSGKRFKQMIIVNLEEGLGFLVDEPADLDGRLLLPPEFLEHELFAKDLEEINQLIEEVIMQYEEEGKDLTKTQISFYQFSGYIIPLEIPFEADTRSPYIQNWGTSGGAECSCNKGGSDCPKKSLFGAVYCDASDCQSCTLSGTVYFPNTGDDPKQLTISNYHISLN